MIDINLKGAWIVAPPRDPAHDRGAARLDRQQLARSPACAAWAASRHYAASKWGLTGLSKSWAIELAPHGIRVNSIHPTGVDTPLNDGLAAMEGMTHAGDRRALGGQPAAGAVDRAEDVADAVLYLAGDGARYVTGTTLVIDAGLLTR